jgi:hypothetical protein
VENLGLGIGDTIALQWNKLDLTDDEGDMADINTLVGRGATVTYTPQNMP